MKHSLKITLFLVLIFIISQAIGLLVVNQYIDHQALHETGNVTYVDLPYDVQRPEVEEQTSFIYIILGVLIGTALVLLLIKLKKAGIWKFWFFLSVLICLTVAFYAFFKDMAGPVFLAYAIPTALAAVLAYYKIFKTNIYIHNFTEVFVYGGLAAIFVPILNLFSVVVLLILISIYDMYAVWKSKHMIALAEFQTELKVFAGLSIPYKLPKKSKKKIIHQGAKTRTEKVKTAILGGGDIAFPLLFGGVVMKDLMLSNTMTIGFLKALIVPIFVAIALLWLLLKSKKDKFYPAMPFLTIGCLIGYGVLFLLNLI